MALLIFLILFSGIALIVYLANQRGNRKAGLSEADRRELELHRDVLIELDNLAFSQREINPELSVQVIDEIRKHRDQVYASRREIEKKND